MMSTAVHNVAVTLLIAAIGVCPWRGADAAMGERVLLNATYASSKALCLDGTSAGYFIDMSQRNSTRWVINIEGGGWCTDTQNCYSRGVSGLGTSRTWPARKPFAPGINNETGWVSVYLPYCDGGSFTGGREDADVFHNATDGTSHDVWYRGRFTLEETVDSLMSKGMANASFVLLTGCSAGGLSSYLHAWYLRSRLSPSTDMAVSPLAGFFMDLPHAAPYPNGTANWAYQDGMQWIFTSMQAEMALNPRCLEKFEPDGKWRCMFAANNAPLIESPLFVQQSVHDAWQVGGVLGLFNWSTNISALMAMGDAMQQELAPLLANTTNGAFLTNCVDHCNVEPVDGTTSTAALEEWLGAARGGTDGPSGTPHRRIWSTAQRPLPDKTCQSGG